VASRWAISCRMPKPATSKTGCRILSSKASLVALGDADSQRFSLGSTQEGTVTVRPDEGTMTISNVTNESRDEVFETDLGAIVYEGKNREVAYQGGGIWTKRGGNSTMTSPPEYYYRGTTLTLPIIQVSGEGAVGGRTQGQITPIDVGQDAVSELPTPLENGTIEIKIQSEYYEGWHTFLSQRTDGQVEIFHNNNTVVSKLTVPDEKVFDTALSVQEDYPANADVVGPSEEFVQHRSARPLIDSKIQDANESGTNLSDADDPLTAGTYYHDGDYELDDDLNIDTSDGNVTIVVDGDFDIRENKIEVSEEDPDYGVEYYISGSLEAQGGAEVKTANEEVEAYRNVFYVGDQFLDTGSGTVEFDAIIYAPDAVIDTQGTAKIRGSLVADDVENFGGNTEIIYDESLSDIIIELTGAGDLLTYLHVSHNEIRVELN